MTRCVRRAYLCGRDRVSGKNFDHRKPWVVERLRFLSTVFAIDVCAYAVMSNHLHVVLHVDRERARGFGADEVVERYTKLFRMAKAQYDSGSKKEKDRLVTLWRERLWNLSWMMRGLSEWVARRANREDGFDGSARRTPVNCAGWIRPTYAGKLCGWGCPRCWCLLARACGLEVRGRCSHLE